eukprot:c2848_g1_i1.p1 GENE.c2848_g1_i1~~c2848_g1_i1.p1  ORF type:complete len:160 (-),score=31.64 c2848_g1_i1:23-502(-)
MLATKRSYDTMMEPSPSSPSHSVCSPHRISFLDSSSAKRLRSPQPATNNVVKSRQYSPFLSRQSDISEEDIDTFVNKFKRAKLNKTMSDESSNTNETQFTQQEVNKIVSLAVQETEDRLRQLYDSLLTDQLSEQYENFTKFNQDFVTRKMKNSTFDYMS